MKLGLPDDQTVRGYIVKLHRQGLGNAHPGRGDQTEKRCVHERPGRTRWAQVRGRSRETGDLISRIDVRDPPSVGCPAQGIGRWNLMAGIFGAHRQCEPPDLKEAPASLGCRGRPRRPVECTLDADELVPMGVSESGEAAQQLMLRMKPEADGAVEFHVSHYVGAQHVMSPSQAWAIGRNMLRSTFA
jgi:hypothetical protein